VDGRCLDIVKSRGFPRIFGPGGFEYLYGFIKCTLGVEICGGAGGPLATFVSMRCTLAQEPLRSTPAVPARKWGSRGGIHSTGVEDCNLVSLSIRRFKQCSTWPQTMVDWYVILKLEEPCFLAVRNDERSLSSSAEVLSMGKSKNSIDRAKLPRQWLCGCACLHASLSALVFSLIGNSFGNCGILLLVI
jgi:hypothetical protein